MYPAAAPMRQRVYLPPEQNNVSIAAVATKELLIVDHRGPDAP